MLLPLVRAVCPATVSTMPLMNVFDAIPLKPANVLRRRSRIAVRRSPVHGRGVFATRALAPGELICEYLGERIAWDEAVLRHPRDPAHPDHTFYFDVGDGTVIDGAVGGNSARWINHACSPNCEAEDRDGRIFIRTVHPVPAGEELSIDYALVVEGRHTRQLRERYACHCGVPECRGTMLAARRRRSTKAALSTPAPDPVADSAGSGTATQTNIRIFERPSPDTLIVAWREAGRCCYSDQRWERTEATAPGVCALSGIPFAPRQTVFRPVGEPAPLNEAARIAESSIAHVAGIDYAAA